MVCTCLYVYVYVYISLPKVTDTEMSPRHASNELRCRRPQEEVVLTAGGFTLLFYTRAQFLPNEFSATFHTVAAAGSVSIFFKLVFV